MTRGFCVRLLINNNSYEDFMGSHQETWDHVEEYFQCIVKCDLDDKECVTECVEVLKEPIES